MRTRIFWNHATGERFELTEDELRARLTASNGPMLMPDIDRVYGGGFRSPIDGSYITSRSQLRRHERTHQVRHAGDFKPGELMAKENRRVQRNRDLVAKEKVSFEWK